MPSPYHAKSFAENSKFLITNGSKLKSTESSKTFKVEPSSGKTNADGDADDYDDDDGDLSLSNTRQRDNNI